jgi:hypothetical protein
MKIKVVKKGNAIPKNTSGCPFIVDDPSLNKK